MLNPGVLRWLPSSEACSCFTVVATLLELLYCSKPPFHSAWHSQQGVLYISLPVQDSVAQMDQTSVKQLNISTRHTLPTEHARVRQCAMHGSAAPRPLSLSNLYQLRSGVQHTQTHNITRIALSRHHTSAACASVPLFPQHALLCEAAACGWWQHGVV